MVQVAAVLLVVALVVAILVVAVETQEMVGQDRVLEIAASQVFMVEAAVVLLVEEVVLGILLIRQAQNILVQVIFRQTQ
jgi:hypothetical protein